MNAEWEIINKRYYESIACRNNKNIVLNTANAQCWASWDHYGQTSQVVNWLTYPQLIIITTWLVPRPRQEDHFSQLSQRDLSHLIKSPILPYALWYEYFLNWDCLSFVRLLVKGSFNNLLYYLKIKMMNFKPMSSTYEFVTYIQMLDKTTMLNNPFHEHTRSLQLAMSSNYPLSLSNSLVIAGETVELYNGCWLVHTCINNRWIK